MNWYKLSLKWQQPEGDNPTYIHVGDDPDFADIPMDNIFIPNEKWNKVYEDTVDEYRDTMEKDVPVQPVLGRIKKELTPYIYDMMRKHDFWQPISDNPQYGHPYAAITNGVHRVNAAKQLGVTTIRVIREFGSNSDWF